MNLNKTPKPQNPKTPLVSYKYIFTNNIKFKREPIASPSL
jgi:hypothetical protein